METVNNQNIDYFDGENEPQEGATLERLIKLAQRSRDEEAEVMRLTSELAEATEKLTKTNRDLIPDVMQELGIQDFTLDDGSKIKIDDKVAASIKPENKEKAYKWLADHGFDGIIKTKVVAEFGKGDIEEARKAQALLLDAKIAATMDQSIHNATLTSFVKERLAAAADVVTEVSQDDGFDAEDTERAPNLPMDIFSVFEYKVAKITLPKKKK